MTDAPLSDAAMRVALLDLHLPSSVPGDAVGELAAAVAFGGLAAVAVAGVLRLITRRRRAHAVEPLTAALDRLAKAPEDVRRVGLLHLLKARAPERFATLRAELYRPGSALTADQLDTELRRRA